MLIVIAGVIFQKYFDQAKLEEQRELISRLGWLSPDDIRSVKVIPKFEPQFTEECLTIEDQASLAELSTYFRRVDDTDYGGHQSPLFRFKLRFEFVDGEEITYIVRRYERFPEDMFLNLYSAKIYDDGSYAYKITPRVRIPGLYPWLKNKVDKAGCSS